MIGSEEEARSYVAEMGDGEALARLARLIASLEVENGMQNLVAEDSLPVVWQRHIADSAQLLELDDPGQGEWLDLGSGAGFPGLVVAILRPKRRVILVESRKRRIDWLRRMTGELGLAQCRIEGRRLEQVETFPAAVISARAFAPLDRLLERSGRFSTGDTRWLLPKGRSAAQEVHKLPKRARSMFHVEQSRTQRDAGIVVGRGQWSHKA